MQHPGANAPSKSADAALVRRIVEGDESALATVYDRYSGLVYSVVLRILRDSNSAEEILQDIFFQLWRTASSFDSARGTLPGWLLVCARNRAISRLRGRNFHATSELAAESALTPVDLESKLAQAQQISRVRGLLEKLSEAQRQALELAYFEGLTHSEIAQRTGEPLGTIKTRLRAALVMLKRALNP